jgi:hypothetical protein
MWFDFVMRARERRQNNKKFVIPAQAGIQRGHRARLVVGDCRNANMDSRLRGNDRAFFYSSHRKKRLAELEQSTTCGAVFTLFCSKLRRRYDEAMQSFLSANSYLRTRTP